MRGGEGTAVGLRRRATAVVGVAALAAAAVAGCGSSTRQGSDGVAWEPCTDLAAYVGDLGVDSAVVDRLQCAVLDVPLDYADPAGRTVELALSRVVGTDPAAPPVFVNPGGPGVEGRSMAATVASELGLGATVVGIDLRGTGYSSRLDCTGPDEPDTRDDAGLTAYADAIAVANRDCVDADPAFLASLTTATAARDLDTVRRALGLDVVDFLGVSWGTVLGAELQTRYPQHLHRVVLDSMDYTGTSGADALRTLATADPDVPPDLLPEPADLAAPVDGGAAPDEPDVPPGDAPGPEDDDAPLDPDTAEFLERSFDAWAGTGYICNSLDPVGDGAAQLAEHRALSTELGRDPQRRIEFPADSAVPGVSLCSGWPLPAEGTAVANTGTDLLIIGHRDEYVTPYVWALDARTAMGGQLLTIEDGIHGSTVGSRCGALVTEFLGSGRLSEQTCDPH
ncbi:alpha/beta fold hydrolase [Rhodococcus sp. SGAir0479]|uniref:alpha/beta fold hydrolase n=1 Tax=Rhodococcus sp. SGAir0479 TaxID=2567884 RepID=UPI0010CCFFEE|nr:alpha/beta hydrolase [Rhodococcus sp. SGAir0479]QCQ90543.1 alpha/beta fold hydrolase [Rhodococcus sp. SGAir0479]